MSPVDGPRAKGHASNDRGTFVAQSDDRSTSDHGSVPASLAGAVDRILEASDEPIRAAFFARALYALTRLSLEVGDAVLGDVAGAESDYTMLVRALEAPGALAALVPQDPLIKARLRGLAARQTLLQREGGVLSAEQVAAHLGLSRQAVDKRRRAGRLIGLSLGRRGYAYPAWQFAEIGTLAGLDEVLAALSVRDPWMQAAFFLSGDPRLDGATPLDELRRGNVDAVRRAAGGYGEHGAA
jgi:putative AbiEi antitoxin of type IV toxin-antitoxin system